MRISAIAIAFLVISCGKGTDDGTGGKAAPLVEPSEVVAIGTPSTPTTTTPPPPAGAADEPAISPAASQCRTILAASWKAIQPVLARVGADPTTLEAGYLADSNYLERCQALTDEQRGCLEGSANPVMAIHECKVNEGKEMNQQLWAPSIGRSTRPRALDPAEGQKTLDSLVGTWVSDWKSYGQVTTWVIRKDGTSTLTTVRDGKTETKTLQITIENEGRIKVQTTPTSTQDYSYFRATPRLVYSSNNLAYGIHPLADQKRFTLTIGSSWLVVEPGTCTAITERAETSAATCTWGKKDGVRTFTSDYAIPGRTRRDGKPMTQQNTYHLIAGALLDERLVDIGTYKKK